MSSFQLHFLCIYYAPVQLVRFWQFIILVQKKYKLAKMSFSKINNFLLNTQRTIVYAFARVQKCLCHTSLRVLAIGPVILGVPFESLRI